MGGNWINLLFIALVLGAPALSWIVGQLREQAELKKARAEALRRRDEELRTGRVTGQADQSRPLVERDDRMTELQRLADRRQQQLQELRARQAQTQQPTAPASPAARGGSQAGGSQAGQRLARGTGMRGQPLPTRPAGQAQRNPNLPPSGGAQPGGSQAGQRLPRGTGMRGQPLPGRGGAQPPQQAQQAQQPRGRAGSTRPPRRGEVIDVVDFQDPSRAGGRGEPVALPKGRSIAQQLAADPIEDKSILKPGARPARVSVAREVRSMLAPARRDRGSGPSLRAVIAVTEILGKPVSMRGESGQSRNPNE